MALTQGAQFAGYTIVRQLGSGGMGEVYLVRHPRFPRLEALGHSISAPTLTPAIALNDNGRKASLDALDKRLHFCFHGVPPAEGCCPPGGCPITHNTVGSDAVENLLSLKSTHDMNYELDPKLMRVHLTGTLNYDAQAITHGQVIPISSTWTVDAKVDLNVDPPAYVPRGQ